LGANHPSQHQAVRDPRADLDPRELVPAVKAGVNVKVAKEARRIATVIATETVTAAVAKAEVSEIVAEPVATRSRKIGTPPRAAQRLPTTDAEVIVAGVIGLDLEELAKVHRGIPEPSRGPTQKPPMARAAAVKEAVRAPAIATAQAIDQEIEAVTVQAVEAEAKADRDSDLDVLAVHQGPVSVLAVDRPRPAPIVGCWTPMSVQRIQ
jgi:hypothetical protein